MTIGDIIEKILALFGVAPKRTRTLCKKVTTINDKILLMEDGLRDMRKRADALEHRMETLKAEYQSETSEHKKRIILMDLERTDNEFRREDELVKRKNVNVEGACVLRGKLEQLLEDAKNGGNYEMLEEVISDIEEMDDEFSQVNDLLAKLDKHRVSEPKLSTRGTPVADLAKENEELAKKFFGGGASPAPAAPAAKPPKTTRTAPAPQAPAPQAPAPAPAPSKPDTPAPGVPVVG